jgi:hypothetical protein
MAAQVYYSVSPFGTGDIKTGTPNCSITSGVATLDVAQTGNIGQGCRLTYGGHVAYISQVNSSTSFNVVTAVGGTPADHASVAVDSIGHEYASLSAAEAGATDANHINNTSLVTADVVCNLACYYDHDDYTADTTAVTIDGWTTDATRSFNVYTPTGGTQSINSQRHSGIWDDHKYKLTNTGTVLTISNNTACFFRITGLQISYDGDSTYNRGIFNGAHSGTSYISKNIIRATACSSCTNTGGILFYNHTAYTTSYIFNNIIYGFGVHVNNYGICSYDLYDILYVYNNIIYGNEYGVWFFNYSAVTFKNNVVFNSTDDFRDEDSAVTRDYNATDDDDSETHGVVAPTWANVFVGHTSTPPNFNLKSGSSLVDAGTDLSGTFTDDITGSTRSGSWDIGAFEYVAAGGGNTYTATAQQTISGAFQRLFRGQRLYTGALMEAIKQSIIDWRKLIWDYGKNYLTKETSNVQHILSIEKYPVP